MCVCVCFVAWFSRVLKGSEVESADRFVTVPPMAAAQCFFFFPVRPEMITALLSTHTHTNTPHTSLEYRNRAQLAESADDTLNVQTFQQIRLLLTSAPHM